MSLLNHPRPSGKLARWALTIQDMDLVFKYRSGKSNSNADALSRNPVTQVPNSENSCQVVCASKVKESHGVDQSSCHDVTTAECSEPSSQVEEPIDKSMPQGTPSREPTGSVHVTEPSSTAGGGANNNSQSSCKDQEVHVDPDDTQKCDCLRKASQEIRAVQKKDLDLVPYFQYYRRENSTY